MRVVPREDRPFVSWLRREDFFSDKSPDGSSMVCKLVCVTILISDGITEMSKKALRSGAICEYLLGLRVCDGTE